MEEPIMNLGSYILVESDDLHMKLIVGFRLFARGISACTFGWA
jgi:hypothetical protein